MYTDDDEVRAFLEEREKKLGGKIIWKTYSTWFAELGGERREYGVFLYTDGLTLMIEDFFKPSTVFGYRISTKSEKEREKNYVKLEIPVELRMGVEVDYCSRRSAEKSLKTLNDVSKRATLFNKIFTKNCTRLKAGGRVFFFELPSFAEFKKVIEKKGELI